jgi:hypothetical protein
VSAEQVRKYCLEFGHDDRAMPGREVLARIVAWTGGEVTERDFYPPHIRGEPVGQGLGVLREHPERVGHATHRQRHGLRQLGRRLRLARPQSRAQQQEPLARLPRVELRGGGVQQLLERLAGF